MSPWLLKHLMEALRIDGIQIRDVEVGRTEVSPEREKHVVHLKRGIAAWFARPRPARGVVEEERDSVMTELLREADSRLRALAREAASRTPPAPAPARPAPRRPAPPVEVER